MELIKTYFPGLPDETLQKLDAYTAQLQEWNTKINLVSRQDTGQIELHHILHALAIAKYTSFVPGTRILDLGTGGGLPGIPLAICFPDTEFTLIDARNKKITAVNAMIADLGLDNCTAMHMRVEELRSEYDFVVSRAVASLGKVWGWCMLRIHRQQKNPMPNGLLIFKGGNLDAELRELPKKAYYEKVPVREYFDDPYFEEKFLVYVQR